MEKRGLLRRVMEKPLGTQFLRIQLNGKLRCEQTVTPSHRPVRPRRLDYRHKRDFFNMAYRLKYQTNLTKIYPLEEYYMIEK